MNQISQPARLLSNLIRTDSGLLIQTKGSRGPAFFLILWLTGWTVGCVFLLFRVFTKPELFTFLFATPFFAGWVAVAGFLVWLLFGRENLLVDEEEVLFERTTFITLSTRRIPRREIRGVQSCQSTHTENDVPLNGIEILGLGSPLRFGFRLPDQERRWLIQELQRELECESSMKERSLPDSVEPSFQSDFLHPSDPADQIPLIGSHREPPSDSLWTLQHEFGLPVFESRGRFLVGAFLTLTFMCLFWNGIVSVFVLALWGFLPGDQAPQGAEWWGMFVFLIPFQVIGLGIFAAWAAVLLQPWCTTTYGMDQHTIFRRRRWPLFGVTKQKPVAEVDRLRLRRASPKESSFQPTQTNSTSYEFVFVNASNQDLLTFDQLTLGEAQWMAAVLREQEPTW